MNIHEGKINVSTKWSKNNVIEADGTIGQLMINRNKITFHIDGYRDVFGRNFVGSGDFHTFKVYTYGQESSDSTGYFYRVSKVFLYNGSDYSDYSGDTIDEIESFSFEIPELTDWLRTPSVEFGQLDDGTSFIHELLTPTINLKECNPKIYIKYEIKDLFEGIDNHNDMSLKKNPRVFVEFDN